MNGKIVLITGANAGIGFETAKELAQKGATTILVCRNQNRGLEAMNKIKAATQNENVYLEICDLASLQSIKHFGERFREKYKKLDVLINNAGVMFNSRVESVDGYEHTFALNHLGSFYITHFLLDALKAAGNARIINVSSLAHRYGRVNFDDLQSHKWYNGLSVYSYTKLCNVLFTNELARRLKHTTITANALHPGVVNTNFSNNASFLWQMGAKLFSNFFLSPRQGAETSIYLASSPDIASESGKYFYNKKAVPAAPQALRQKDAERLWDESLLMCRLDNFGIDFKI